MSLPDIGKTTLLGEQQEQIVLAFSPARLAGMGLIFSRLPMPSGRKMRLSRQE
jgi:multidrug efflux pump subunit AcrB